MVLMFEQDNIQATRVKGCSVKEVLKSLVPNSPFKFSLVMAGDDDVYTLFQDMHPVVGGLNRTNADNLLFLLSELFEDGHGQSLLYILNRPAAVTPELVASEALDDENHFLLEYLMKGSHYRDVCSLAQGVFNLHPIIAKDLSLKDVTDLVDAPNEQFLISPHGILFFPY